MLWRSWTFCKASTITKVEASTIGSQRSPRGTGVYDLKDGAYEESTALSDEINHESMRDEKEELELYDDSYSFQQGAHRRRTSFAVEPLVAGGGVLCH